MTDKLDPERAVRLLRAKASELEMEVLDEDISHGDIGQQGQLRADIALVAGLLADHMEVVNATLALYVAHSENLIERAHLLEQARHYHTKTGKVLMDEDIEALALEAEEGYDISKIIERVKDGE